MLRDSARTVGRTKEYALHASRRVHTRVHNLVCPFLAPASEREWAARLKPCWPSCANSAQACKCRSIVRLSNSTRNYAGWMEASRHKLKPKRGIQVLRFASSSSSLSFFSFFSFSTRIQTSLSSTTLFLGSDKLVEGRIRKRECAWMRGVFETSFTHRTTSRVDAQGQVFAEGRFFFRKSSSDVCPDRSTARGMESVDGWT